jgi:hypothetical protein
MVGAVKKVTNGVSDGMAKEQRTMEKEEKESEERAIRREIERKEEEKWKRG